MLEKKKEEETPSSSHSPSFFLPNGRCSDSVSPFVFLVLATGRWPEWGSSLLACAAATQDQASDLGYGDVEIEGPDAG